MSTAFADIHVDWRDVALCRQFDPEVWFPPKGGSPREAKQICAACPAIDDCRDYAIERGEQFGVWGGTSEKERQKQRTQQAKARKPEGATK